jgi:hypothetical protein
MAISTKLPTDDLYRFFAVSGVFLYVFLVSASIYIQYLEWQDNQVYSDKFYKNKFESDLEDIYRCEEELARKKPQANRDHTFERCGYRVDLGKDFAKTALKDKKAMLLKRVKEREADILNNVPLIDVGILRKMNTTNIFFFGYLVSAVFAIFGVFGGIGEYKTRKNLMISQTNREKSEAEMLEKKTLAEVKLLEVETKLMQVKASERRWFKE